MLRTLTTSFREMVTAALAWAKEMLAPMTNLILEAFSAMSSVGRVIVDTLRGPLDEAIQSVVQMGSRIASTLSGLVGQARSSAQSIGDGIVAGIRDGVMSAAASLAAAAAAVVRRAIQAARSAAGIWSPSKVFNVEVGRPMVAGIVRGLEDASPTLDRAMGALVQPPAVPAYAGGMPAASGGGGITISFAGATIYGFSDFESKVVGAIESATRRGRL
jgi:phage-related protein